MELGPHSWHLKAERRFSYKESRGYPGLDGQRPNYEKAPFDGSFQVGGKFQASLPNRI